MMLEMDLLEHMLPVQKESVRQIFLESPGRRRQAQKVKPKFKRLDDSRV
jgi:hypothetical protein